MMPTSALRHHLEQSLVAFAWDEWAQLGVFSHASRRSPWVQDLEALLIFTLEIARLDPRLFDEVLDWMVVNEDLLSVRRLRALTGGDEDQRLVNAALGWLATHRPRTRLAGRRGDRDIEELDPLFYDTASWNRDVDPSFAEQGFARATMEPSGKSQVPDLWLPIGLGLRLRHLLGVSARAEVVRYLLTMESPWATSQVVAWSAGYAKRNVYEALTSMQASGVVDAQSVGGELRYSIDRDAWSRLLDVPPGGWPVHRDWPQLLTALRTIVRGLRQIELEHSSEYATASAIVDLLEQVRGDLSYAGVRVPDGTRASEAMADLTSTVQWALGLIGGVGLSDWPADSADRDILDTWRFVVYPDAAGGSRWRLVTAVGEVVAASRESYASPGHARRAATLFMNDASSYDVVVEPLASGLWQWRMHAGNGMVVAESPEPLATVNSASLAADRVLAHVARALEPSDLGEEGFFGSDTERRIVQPHPAGGWAVVKPGGSRASAHEKTIDDAVDRAREILWRAGGGELVVRDASGRTQKAELIFPDNEG